MRVPVLLMLFLWIALIFCAAPAASVAQTAPAQPSTSLQFSVDSGAIIPADGSSLTPEHFSLAGPYELDGRDLEGRHICLKMRTYVVARDDQDSDSTHFRSYHECLPAWKVDLRTSQQPQEKAPATR